MLLFDILDLKVRSLTENSIHITVTTHAQALYFGCVCWLHGITSLEFVYGIAVEQNLLHIIFLIIVNVTFISMTFTCEMVNLNILWAVVNVHSSWS